MLRNFKLGDVRKLSSSVRRLTATTSRLSFWAMFRMYLCQMLLGGMRGCVQSSWEVFVLIWVWKYSVVVELNCTARRSLELIINQVLHKTTIQ